ncbi:uncharacterized protein PHALS_02248 [Plasmopara halstedii]|uniref:Uncharacterized protein n=1 Tax=Plasmopara halstedii TaxID=4781 RepID=A0A0N7L728_PLAHL|nr:uncharacterized protein PHALS_02248 [Plasmopara halstedii]CEG45915.1 hypothetical protein PHALS_02248 [Plasmopara halstedii]|eukprot:XP_024582284.1 hypothetical protein PHALS_02248 [Plasmopara halstedii]
MVPMLGIQPVLEKRRFTWTSPTSYQEIKSYTGLYIIYGVNETCHTNVNTPKMAGQDLISFAVKTPIQAYGA